MALNNLYRIEDYRREKASKPKLALVSRRVPMVNLSRLTLQEFNETPDLELTAQMERICEYINEVERQRSSRPRVSKNGINLCRDILTARGKSRNDLVKDLMSSTEKEWQDHPNHYLALMNVIEELTPPTTKS